DDPKLLNFDLPGSPPRLNGNTLSNFIQMRENPFAPGQYYGVDAPEFGTHAAGQVVSFDAPPSTRADQIQVTYWTNRATASATPAIGHSGMYRNPLPLSDGTVVVSHTAYQDEDGNDSTRANPTSHYAFRLKMLSAFAGGASTAGAELTGGIA